VHYRRLAIPGHVPITACRKWASLLQYDNAIRTIIYAKIAACGDNIASTPQGSAIFFTIHRRFLAF
jgi:hypothetical protein